MHSEFLERLDRINRSAKSLQDEQKQADCVDLRYIDEARAASESARKAATQGDAEMAWGEMGRAESCLFWVRRDLEVQIRLLAEVRQTFCFSA
jgi:hypothetical protein